MSANRDELSPLALLRRSALAYPHRVAVRDGERTLSFTELAERAWRLGDALRALGVDAEERVAMLSLNRSELLEAHFGVPASRGALCAINTRLAPPEVRFIVEHCGARVLLLDPELEAAASRAVGAAGPARRAARERVRAAARRRRARSRRTGPTARTGRSRWTTRAARPARRRASSTPIAAPISVRSPTSSRRASALTAATSGRCRCSIATAGASAGRWPASAPRASSLPRPEPAAVWRELRAGATHLCAAPTVLITLLAHADAAPLEHAVTCVVGGAPPSPTLIERCEAVGIRLCTCTA